MKKSHIVKALNMSSGEVLTLDKAEDRMEFEALPMLFADDRAGCRERCNCNGMDCGCYNAGGGYTAPTTSN